MNDDWHLLDDPRVVKVEIAGYEILAEPQHWLGMTISNVIALLMHRKGLKMKPSVDPHANELLPPFRIVKKAEGSWVIWQWQEDRKP